MKVLDRLLLVAASLVALHSAAGALQSAPVLSSLSDSSLARSGRLRLFGSGFGTVQGASEVRIDGLSAIVTSWASDEIHAYVPEAAALGTVGVEVVTTGGASASLPLAVTLRQSEGRVAWRFEIDSWAATHHRAGIGPDGTVYFDEGLGRLYAVASDGALRWVYDTDGAVDGGAADGPIVVGADGTVYTAANPLGPDTTIHAINPDGTQKWVFTTSGGQGVIAGPGIGPDGNLYAVIDNGTTSIGAFSLDPDGNLRWSDTGDPPVNEHGQLGQELSFGPDRVYFGFDEYGVSAPTFFGFSLDGNQRFAFGGPADRCGSVASPDGTVYVRLGGGPGVMSALDPDGNLLWSAPQPAPNNTLENPVIGPDGTLYTVRNLDDFWALNPDGSTRWYVDDQAHGIMGHLGVSPDNSVILDGGRLTYGAPGWIRAYDPADASLLWHIDLPDEQDLYGEVLANNPPAFTPDSQRAYYVALVAGVAPSNERSYLYAIDLGDAAAEPGTALCFGDGSGAACPCGNESPGTGEGCTHSGGVGMLIRGGGTSSVAADDLTLQVDQCPQGNSGIFYAGTQSLAPGNALFDGLQCAGGDVRRFRGRFQSAGSVTDAGFVAQDPSGIYFAAGTSYYFQYWTRDVAAGGSPCASLANFSPAYAVTATP